MAQTDLAEFLAAPLWIAAIAKGITGDSGQRSWPLLRQRFFAQPGFFSQLEPITDVVDGGEIKESFNQKPLSFEFDGKAPLLAAIAVSQEDSFDSAAGVRVLHLPDGGVRPDPETKRLYFPVGSLILREPQAKPRQRCQDRALSAVPSPRMTALGWLRRHYLYQNPTRLFTATAIVYRDQQDRICFVEQFDLDASECPCTRFALEW